ncbi:hypothetical protein Tco_0155981 [Tanacetum coccineum]
MGDRLKQNAALLTSFCFDLQLGHEWQWLSKECNKTWQVGLIGMLDRVVVLQPETTCRVESHDGGSSQGQEPERSELLKEICLVVMINGILPLWGLVASAASAFDAAKYIMGALRSKHTNLASELEVTSW